MIPNVSQDFIDAMKSPNKIMYVKLEIFDSNMKFLKEITQSTTAENLGFISVNTDQPIRSSFSFNLVNKNNEFDFGDSNLIWIDKRIKLYIGLQTKNGIEYIPRGVYVLSTPSGSHNFNGNIAGIQGYDKAFLLTDSRGKFINELQIATGTKITDAIKTIASEVGETMFNFDSNINATVPYQLTYSSDSSRFSAMKELADLAKCDIYYDENGYLRLRSIDLNEYEQYPTQWTYEYGSSDEKFYAGNVRKMDDSEMCNYVRVLGGSGQSAAVMYDLVVDETYTNASGDQIWKDSPYSIQKIGTIFYAHNNGSPDPLITDTNSALWRAKYTLREKLGFNEQLEIQISPNFLHTGNDIIEIIDSSNSVNGKYLIKSMQIPLSPQLMTIDCVKYIRIITDWNFI